jgi:hypothetical protein
MAFLKGDGIHTNLLIIGGWLLYLVINATISSEIVAQFIGRYLLGDEVYYRK